MTENPVLTTILAPTKVSWRGAVNRMISPVLVYGSRSAVVSAALLLGVGLVLPIGTARADELGYVINVTLGPGYNFPNAEAALDYGHGLCSGVATGKSYAQQIAAIKSDLETNDEYQASYLISQAIEELCPVLITQLRNSAAGYRPGQS